ncbi:restriction endonuclease subunit S [Prevotella melaninogenica]|uniref:restriction endonuclease subunit S n=1 Tax=Prevotella melaninogenica TaxID=28132 RepID=UPI00356B6838
MVQINPKNYVDDNKEAAFIPMEKIEATYLSSYTYTVRKWREIKSGYTHFANGDVAFAKITPCFQNRKSMILKSLPNGIGAGTSELKVLRTYSDTISKEYLLFFLESPYFVEEAIFKGTANQQRIISGYLENKLFPLPPLNEQRSIAEKIKNSLVNVERYAKLQDKLEYLNNNLNTFLKKSILQEAIQGKLVPQDPNDEPASVLLQRIKEEKLRLVKEGKLKKKDVVDSIIYKGDDNKYYEQIGKNLIDITDAIPFEIPNNWVWTRLSNVANIYTGNSISETEKKDKYTNVIGRYYIGTKDVGFDNNVFYNNGIAIPKKYEQDFRIAPKDSILMCIEGGSAGRKIAMLNQDVCFGNKLCCFASFIEMGKFIYYYLQSPSFTDMFNQNKAGIIGGVSLAKVKGILIPLPPLKEQFHIINRLDELYAHL